MTVAHVYTVAFQGIEAREVDVQVHIADSGGGQFNVVGLADKAVAESRERVRAALSAIGLALPFKRITVNLAPADLPKEGSHYDLPIALGLLAAMGVLPASEMANYVALGELSLDAAVTPVAGVLPAAIAASEQNRGLICPAGNGPEAAFAGGIEILATPSLIALVNHMKGASVLAPPVPRAGETRRAAPDLRDVKGQESAKRALEIAAAGGHNLLMIGPPGAGKSMLAQRLPGLLPPLDAREALEISMIQSLAGALEGGAISPRAAVPQSASFRLDGGAGRRRPEGEAGRGLAGASGRAVPGRAAGVPARAVLDSLRQPIETGEAVVARANAHVRYPARFQLVAAMNPCRCGYLSDPAQGCGRAPKCASDYQARISGPLFDRIDMHVEVAGVSAADLTLPPPAEGSADVARAGGRGARQSSARACSDTASAPMPKPKANCWTAIATPDAAGVKLLTEAAERMRLSARGYHRVLKVARTIADLAGAETVGQAPYRRGAVVPPDHAPALRRPVGRS